MLARMKAKRLLFALLISSASVLLGCSLVLGQQSEIPAWDFALRVVDADLSPDGGLLAVTTESGRTPQEVGQETTVSLEVWDYRQRKAVATMRLAPYRRSTVRTIPRPVRFSSDGSLLAVADVATVRVLEASTLKPLRSIRTAVDPDWEINSIETSPVGHLAIITSGGYERGHVFVYDLDAGTPLLRWDPPQDTAHSMAWKPDGTLFAIGASRPCSPMGEVDIFAANSWTHVKTLKARNAVSLAFSNERLYAVQPGHCKGLFFGHHLGIEVFDTQGWEPLDPIVVKGEDIHDFVSFANGRLLADTGKLKSEHNWLDATTWGVATDEQVTIWKGDVQSLIFTSPLSSTSPGFATRKLRLSRTGRVILSLESEHLKVFELP
jgi:WD40 repeat protein